MIRAGLPILLAFAIGVGPAGSGLAKETAGAAADASRSGMPGDLLSAVLTANRPLVVYKVSEVPVQLLALSDMNVRTVADAEKPYNVTDVVMGGQEAWPFERLVWAVRVGPFYLINREVGGDVSNAGITAYRLQDDGTARFAWSAVTMNPGQLDGLSTYRTFDAFQVALGEGKVRGSTGNCDAWLSASQDALRQMLLPAAGKPIRQLGNLPVGVRAMVERRLLDRGNYRLQWANFVEGGYVIQLAPVTSGKARIAVIRTPVRQASDLLWLGSPGDFDDFQAFQRKLKSTMSVEVEDAIRSRQCQALPGGWPRPGSTPIIAPMPR